MTRNTETSSRPSKTSNTTSQSAPEQKTQDSFSLVLFLGHLLTSVFYAVYGL